MLMDWSPIHFPFTSRYNVELCHWRTLEGPWRRNGFLFPLGASLTSSCSTVSPAWGSYTVTFSAPRCHSGFSSSRLLQCRYGFSRASSCSVALWRLCRRVPCICTTWRQPKRQAEGHQCDSSPGVAPCTCLMALQWVCGIALPCGGHPLAPLQQVSSKFHLQQFCHLPSRETWVWSGSQSSLGWAYYLVSYLRPGNSSCSLHLLFLCSLKFSLFLISQCSILPIYYI